MLTNLQVSWVLILFLAGFSHVSLVRVGGVISAANLGCVSHVLEVG